MKKYNELSNEIEVLYKSMKCCKFYYEGEKVV